MERKKVWIEFTTHLHQANKQLKTSEDFLLKSGLDPMTHRDLEGRFRGAREAQESCIEKFSNFESQVLGITGPPPYADTYTEEQVDQGAPLQAMISHLKKAIEMTAAACKQWNSGEYFEEYGFSGRIKKHDLHTVFQKTRIIDIQADLLTRLTEELNKHGMNDLLEGASAVSTSAPSIRESEPPIVHDAYRRESLRPQQHEQFNQVTSETVRQPAPTPVEALVHSYNSTAAEPRRIQEFRDRYQPDRLDVSNAMERMRGTGGGIAPVFQPSNSGIYLAVAYGTEQNRYMVVPQFELTLQQSVYGPGAMGEVFECPGFDPQRRYPKFKLIRPALFETDAGRRHWSLVEKGEIELGQGD